MTRPIRSGPYRTFRPLQPQESYLEYEGSTITIPMRARKSPNDPWMMDEIKLKAFMRLEIYPTYVNNLGTREFQFTIRDWELYGTCPMLNRLFFDDPRGKFWQAGGLSDYVPATVTFRVANSYRVHVDGPLSPSDVFEDPKALDLRNITSHSFRHWAVFEERGQDSWTYTKPDNKLYFEILPPKSLSADSIRDVVAKHREASTAFGLAHVGDEAPLIVFHKKAPGADAATADFNLGDAVDRARYLLALGSVTSPREGAVIAGEPGDGPQPRRNLGIRAANTLRGLESNKTQIQGNTVLSSNSRAREGVELNWALSPKLRNRDDLDKLLEAAGGRIRGYIQMTSPARSLCTADQAPAVGDPIDSADFPARIIYAINYDIFLNNEHFEEDQAGIAIAVGATEIPPRDVTVAFDKVHLGRVLSRYLEFDKGHCTGMHEITPEEFHAGVNQARYWRTVPLSPDIGWEGFAPFDPERSY